MSPTAVWEVGGSMMIGEKDVDMLLSLYSRRRCSVDYDHAARKELQKLAWFLGMEGQTEACKAIMQYAKEPEPYKSNDYHYGVY